MAKLKPYPTIYLVAAEKLGVNASECIVIEDSTVGLNAAKGAKMRCLSPHSQPPLNRSTKARRSA